ncbi:MAG: hypothetical protein R2827_02150 [Bdellovibrionales bacterium]
MPESTHKLAKELETSLQPFANIKEIPVSVQANSVFVKIPKPWTKPLKEELFFYVWDEQVDHALDCVRLTQTERHNKILSQKIRTLSD